MHRSGLRLRLAVAAVGAAPPGDVDAVLRVGVRGRRRPRPRALATSPRAGRHCRQSAACRCRGDARRAPSPRRARIGGPGRLGRDRPRRLPTRRSVTRPPPARAILRRCGRVQRLPYGQLRRPVATAETHRVLVRPHQRAPLASPFRRARRRAPAPVFSPGSTSHALGPRHRDGAASKVGSQTPAGPRAPRQERCAEHHALLPAAAAAPPQRPPRCAIRAACARDDRQATERAADQVGGGPTRSRVRYVDHGCSELAAVSIRGRRGYSIASRARGLSSSAHHTRATKRRTASASLRIVVG